MHVVIHREPEFCGSDAVGDLEEHNDGGGLASVHVRRRGPPVRQHDEAIAVVALQICQPEVGIADLQNSPALVRDLQLKLDEAMTGCRDEKR